MAEQREVYRARANKAGAPKTPQTPPAGAPKTPGGGQNPPPRGQRPTRPQNPQKPQTPQRAQNPQNPQRPRRPKNPKRRKPWVLAACLLCLVVVVVVVVVLLTRQKAEPHPDTPDYGTPAAAWQKNELGYYFNESGEAMPAAVLKGIDVSKYQGEVDWEQAKAAGIDFAIIRCGYGGEWDGQQANWNQDDDQWRRNADECTRLGIPFGVYLYSYATTEEEARSEADHVARLLGLVEPPYDGLESYTDTPYQLSYPVYYDLEDKSISEIFPSEMAAITAAFFDQLQSYGYTGEQGLYASLNWVRARFSDEAFDPWRENLWIARFADELGYTGTYDMWQCSYTAAGADYGVQSETVDIDFVMRPFIFTGIADAIGNPVAPTFVNDTRQYELHLDAKDARATLTTNGPTEPPNENHTTAIYWTSSDTAVATVDQNGTVLAKGEGQCTVTATLADGTEQISCLVRVGNITIPVFATGNLRGQRANDTLSLADAAALKASTADSILLDAGGSLHGTTAASLTGGMDMLSAFNAAGYDLQTFGALDLAYGIARLRSDANMTSGPSLAANLRDADGAAIFYRSTSWNRNRITNGMNYIVERAGYKIGFFALADADTVNEQISLVNEATPRANDLLQTATEQVAALQASGADAILCIATPGVDVAALQSELQKLGVTAIIDANAAESGDATVLAAATGLDSIARLDLTFTPDGRVSTATGSIPAATLTANRETWTALTTTDAAEAESQPAADADNGENAENADNAEQGESVHEEDTATGDIAQEEPEETPEQKGADAYQYATEALAELDVSDQSILNTPLFTYARNPDAENTISFGNYLAALYSEIATNDLPNLAAQNEADAALPLAALAGGAGEPEYGEITRRALIEAVPVTTRLQLVRTTAEAVSALIDSGTVSRTYLESLMAYDETGTVLLVTDTATLATLTDPDYTVLRDYGDVFWNVRMNINDLTNNFADDFTLPEATQIGVGRGE